ncbi:SdpI family protein [Corynebacterium diphtheriae]|uniref:SdpI family protein n=1 Tax=Corynebacterium diphtheriae TaxID=1717 RepID=UPI0002468F76|nr:SdpI family protein [Corynebacterium diphtheriae]AEX68790.1 putative integral membrane protein [Corynebacterium diphtheriae PW8]OKY20762.1 hypothetical protein AO271_05145 [Corynebacterium diphtheriae]UEB38689.1 SdpI family protein [Corynebacterium diphtheriae]CAB0578984.1 membrane protein [Corynebacterium diphtheriae]SUY72952.1 putative integral membrane protein [Corynebacterium diphtheriae bv. mitis]
MPIAAALSASVGLILLSVLCLTLPKVAMSGNIQRNSAIGIRTKETKKSDSAWLEGHRKATPILRATGIITLGITAILLVSSFFQAFPPLLPVVSGILAYGVLFAGFIAGAVVANKAAKNVNIQKGI